MSPNINLEKRLLYWLCKYSGNTYYCIVCFTVIYYIRLLTLSWTSFVCTYFFLYAPGTFFARAPQSTITFSISRTSLVAHNYSEFKVYLFAMNILENITSVIYCHRKPYVYIALIV